MGVIYKIINIVNNKCYIGSAKHYISRKSKHLSDLRRNNHHCIKLQNSFNKYGENNFKFSIIESDINTNNLLNIEQNYLDLLKPELNTSKYAVSGYGRFKDKVCCFDLKGNLLNEFNSADEAAYFYNVIDSKLRSVCNFERKTHKGMSFRWKKYVNKKGLENIKDEILNIKRNITYQKINQLDLNGNIIKEWNSIAEAAKCLNLSYEPIRLCCNGNIYTSYNYKWEYVNEKLSEKSRDRINKKNILKKENKKNHKYLNNKHSIPVISYNLKNNKIIEFPSSKEVQRVLGVNQSNIWKVLNGHISQCNGYNFKYK